MTEKFLLRRGELSLVRLFIEGQRCHFAKGRKHMAGSYRRLPEIRKTDLDRQLEADLGGKYYEINLEGPGSWACFREYLYKSRRWKERA